MGVTKGAFELRIARRAYSNVPARVVGGSGCRRSEVPAAQLKATLTHSATRAPALYNDDEHGRRFTGSRLCWIARRATLPKKEKDLSKHTRRQMPHSAHL